MPQNEKNNLISIDEVIFRAKSQGIDFGKGNPRERLRYLTKIGLLPNAKRKSFNGLPPHGAYPEYVIEILKEIDEKIKSGKSIQEIKKERERKTLGELPYTYRRYTYPPILEVPPSKIEIPQVEKEIFPKLKPLKKIATVLKIVFLVLILGGAIFFLSGQKIKENFYPYLLATLSWVQKLVQAPPAPMEEMPEKKIFLPPSPEPYLTINAETDINAPLNVKETITTPTLTLGKDEFKGTLTSADLTTDRTYIFPNLSGTICLTTGNCIGLGGEVTSPGGVPNRLAKFVTSQEIGISSINDFYLRGIALTIDRFGNVGIGTVRPRAQLDVAGELITDGKVGIGIEDPGYPLHVKGRIQATGDVCTNLGGGRCLSQVTTGPIFWSGGGISGSGSTNYLSIWTDSTALGNSIIYQSGSNIGIGTTAPAQKLDVAGIIKMTGFQLPTNATSGYILTSDASGFGTWQPAATGTLPIGTSGQTLRHDGTSWLANSFLYNTGDTIGIGTTSTLATLTLSGQAIFSTTTLPQLSLRYDDNNYLNFVINDSQSLIEASKKLVFNSLTGEIRLGSNVSLFDGFGAEIRGATFISTTTDSTVRKSGELVFRAIIPIFLYPVPAQTTSTSYTAVSKTFSSTDSLNSITPAQLPGTTRIYAFLINFSDNIATTSSSTWRVYRPNAAATTFSFEFDGQNLPSLETGNPHLTATTTLPDNDWRLEVRNPSSDKTIRIFNIFLLTFDQIL